MPADVSNYVVDSYVRLRKRSKDDDAQAKSHTYTSARTLLGVLRLSQALARLRFSDLVQRADVDEALRLMDVSKKSLADEDEDAPEHDRSDVSKIFRLIKEMAKQAQGGKKGRRARGKRFGRGPAGERDMDVDEDEEEQDTEELSLVDIRSRVLTSGFTEAQLMETILEVRLVVEYSDCLIDVLYSTKVSTSGPASPATRSCGSSRLTRLPHVYDFTRPCFCFVPTCSTSPCSSVYLGYLHCALRLLCCLYCSVAQIYIRPLHKI